MTRRMRIGWSCLGGMRPAVVGGHFDEFDPTGDDMDEPRRLTVLGPDTPAHVIEEAAARLLAAAPDLRFVDAVPLPFSRGLGMLVHHGRQSAETWGWRAQCDNEPVWLLGGTVDCPDCLGSAQPEATT